MWHLGLLSVAVNVAIKVVYGNRNMTYRVAKDVVDCIS